MLPCPARPCAARPGSEAGVSVPESAGKGELGQGHPEQAEHDGEDADGIKNAEPDLAHGSGLLSGQNDVSDGSMCKKQQPQTEAQNFHTRVLYFDGADVLY